MRASGPSGRGLAVTAVLASTVLAGGSVAGAAPPQPPGAVVVPSPNVGAGDNELRGVAAFSPGSALAVGSSLDEDSGRLRTLITRLDGAEWTVAKSPNASASDNVLNAVAGTTPEDAWAVGSAAGAVPGPSADRPGREPTRTLVEHFDGGTWRVVKSPSPSHGFNELSGATAFGPTDAWAVGHYEPADETWTRTLVARWDGARWAQVPSPNPGRHNRLYGVAGSGPDLLWAVGTTEQVDGPVRPLALRWKDGQWRAVPVPGTSADDTVLRAVTVVSDTEAWAVGFRQGAVRSPFMLRWDGVVWSEMATPYPTRLDLTGVAASSVTDVWVIGYEWLPPPADTQTKFVVMHWNGGEWSVCGIREREQVGVITATGAVAPKDTGVVLAVGHQHAEQRPGARSTLVVRGAAPTGQCR